MSITAPRRPVQIPEEVRTRLRRMIIGLVTVVLAIGAGWLGIVLAPHMGKILLTAAALILLWLVVVTAVDFFRDS